MYVVAKTTPDTPLYYKDGLELAGQQPPAWVKNVWEATWYESEGEAFAAAPLNVVFDVVNIYAEQLV